MDFKKLAEQAKSAVDKRGGTESLKQDFAQLKNIASSKGSLTAKAKEAVSAIKDPGERGASTTAPPAAATPPVSPPPVPNASTAPTPDPAAPTAEGHGKHHGEGKGRHRQEQQ